MTESEMENVLLAQLENPDGDSLQAMWDLAQFYKLTGQVEKAMIRFRQLLDGANDTEIKAQIILSMGQTAEKSNDFALAVKFYRQAMGLEPENKFAWYFIHNNLGYSLNQLGMHKEAESYCLSAIWIDSHRPNAFKNLGLALIGQKRFQEAARAFVHSTQADASDARATAHLDSLLKEHPELQDEFGDELEQCRKAVAQAAARNRQRLC